MCSWCGKYFPVDKLMFAYFEMVKTDYNNEVEIRKRMDDNPVSWFDEKGVDSLCFYDQLRCTVGKAYVCHDCLKEDNETQERLSKL